MKLDYFLQSYVFEKISSMTDDGFIVVDRKGNVIHINDKYCNFLGVNKENVLGKSIFNIIPTSKMMDIMDNKQCEECAVMYYSLGTEKEKRAIVNRTYVEDTHGEVIAGVAQVKFRLETLDIAKKLIKEYTEFEYYKDQYFLTKDIKFVSSFDCIIGNSKEIAEVKKLGLKAAKTDFSVLLTGDTGTGKELFAHAIHCSSKRANKLIVCLNCAAIPENLFESEFFGYEEGAFTGAKKAGKQGKFLIADGGTIFLDEIAELPLAMQAKLLRVLEEKEIDLIGGSKSIPIDVRVISATKRDLFKMVEDGLFREDLYYRLNVIHIKLPCLSQRKDDILLLTDFFLSKLNYEYDTFVEISNDVKKCFLEYKWPGNVRELNNIIKSAYALSDDFSIQLKDLPIKISQCINLDCNSEIVSLKNIMDFHEKSVILAELRKNNWNCCLTAKQLKIHRSVLYKKIKKYKLEADIKNCF